MQNSSEFPQARRQFLGDAARISAVFPLVALQQSTSFLAPGEREHRESGDHVSDLGLIDVVSFGARGDGRANDQTAIAAAAASAPASGGTLWLPPRFGYRIAADLSLPAHVALAIPFGARFIVESGSELTIAGPISAGATEIFSGDGLTTLRRSMVISPEWFGASEDPSSDNGPAFQRAFAAAAAGSRILLTGARYPFRSGFRIPVETHVSLEGMGSATELVMSPGFGRDNALIQYVGSEQRRLRNHSLKCLRIRGQGDGASDGYGIYVDWTTDLVLQDIHLTDIRNTALLCAHAWDTKLQMVRVFNCGDEIARRPAVFVGHRPGTTDPDYVNTLAAHLVTIERSRGVGVHVRLANNISFTNCKFHGRNANDRDSHSSQELVLIEDGRLVRITAGCQFTEARTGLGTGAIRITGQRSTVILEGAVFNNIGDDDTYAIHFDCPSPLARLVMNGLLFADTRSRTRYVYAAPETDSRVLHLGNSIGASSPGMERPR